MAEIPHLAPNLQELGPDPEELELVFEADFASEGVDEIVRIEDDGVVAYAYCWKNNDIVGLVWLYNHGLAPAPDHPRGKGLPQPNFVGFAKNEPFTPLKSEDELEVDWDLDEKRFLISIRGELHAIVGEGTFPGWCVLAENPNSLACKLTLE